MSTRYVVKIGLDASTPPKVTITAEDAGGNSVGNPEKLKIKKNEKIEWQSDFTFSLLFEKSPFQNGDIVVGAAGGQGESVERTIKGNAASGKKFYYAVCVLTANNTVSSLDPELEIEPEGSPAGGPGQEDPSKP